MRATRTILPHSTKLLLGLISVALVDHSERIRALLEKYQITLPEQIQASALVHHVLQAIEQKGQPFHQELARLLQELYPDQSHYDSYVDIIAGAVGALANAATNIKSSRQLKVDASNQMLNSMWAYKAQQNQHKSQSDAQQEKNKSTIKILQVLALITGLSALGIIGFFILKKQPS